MMTLHQILMKLNGNIYPVGDSRFDEDNLRNLKALIGVVSLAVEDIRLIALHAGSHEASVKAIGKCAQDYLYELKD